MAVATDLERVQEKQTRRYRVLRRLYDLTDGNEGRGERFFDLADQEGLTREQAEEVLYYLKGEGLIRLMATGPIVAITHAGVVEVEDSIKDPQRPTEHFSASVIQYFNGAVGAVQNAANSTAHVTQAIGIDGAELMRLIEQLRPQLRPDLEDEQRREANELLDALEVEAKSSRPKGALLRAIGSRLPSFLMDAGSSLLATWLATHLLGTS